MKGAKEVLEWRKSQHVVPPPPEINMDEVKALEKELHKTRSQVDHPKSKARHLEMQIATLTNTILPPRKNIVDECLLHKCKRVVDRENARTYCPECGESNMFQSHIFDRDHKESADLSHGGAMTQTVSQPLFSFTPAHVMEQVSIGFAKIHSTDPAKVTVARTSQIMKNVKSGRRSHSKIANEMKALPITFFPKRIKR